MWKIIKISIGLYLQFCRYVGKVIAIAVCWQWDSGIGGGPIERAHAPHSLVIPFTMLGTAENPDTGSGMVVSGFWYLVAGYQGLMDSPCSRRQVNVQIAEAVMLRIPVVHV